MKDLLIELLTATVLFCGQYVDPAKFGLHQCTQKVMECVDSSKLYRTEDLRKEWEYCQDWIAF